MGESPTVRHHRRPAARQRRRRVAGGDRTRTVERFDLWRDLLPPVIAVGPIDQTVRRGFGRASPSWKPAIPFPAQIGSVSDLTQWSGQPAEGLLMNVVAVVCGDDR